ncbi:hypothetical protein TIFTF001_028704 [Ficus carica]|uniref:Uncharacterized protein n=1 Tax=Ficus carica TaxID=3494 RepID=A0AA88DQU7_FICCA|nr:hypothetical protein TIFTF001_028704 [Ficus carica]
MRGGRRERGLQIATKGRRAKVIVGRGGQSPTPIAGGRGER